MNNDNIAKETIFGKLTGNTATVIYTADSPTYIRSMTGIDNLGGTTALTVDVYDGTNSYKKRAALALTAGTEAAINNEFLLPHGWSIRMTSGDAAGKIDYSLTYDVPNAAGRGR